MFVIPGNRFEGRFKEKIDKLNSSYQTKMSGLLLIENLPSFANLLVNKYFVLLT